MEPNRTIIDLGSPPSKNNCKERFAETILEFILSKHLSDFTLYGCGAALMLCKVLVGGSTRVCPPGESGSKKHTVDKVVDFFGIKART